MNKNSPDYYAQIEEKLYTAVLADIMDSLGYRQQIMPHTLRPLYPEAKMAGRAATMATTEIDTISDNPYKLELALLDDLKPGELVVCATQGSTRAALWGELLSTHTHAKGGRGALIDGLSRDAAKIIEMRFPVFALGLLPADSRGRLEVVTIRQPVKIGEVLIQDGDLIVADLDGCVAIPRAVEDQVIEQAFVKVAAENVVRDLLAKGASIQQVF
ncbi:MAG: RraA family protein, partial [Chloroflexota bacterium]